MIDRKVGSFKCLILKHRRGDQILQPFCRIGFPQEIGSTLFNLRKFSKTDKIFVESCRMQWNLRNDREFGSLIWIKGSHSPELITPPPPSPTTQEIRSSRFNLREFSNSDKGNAESCRMHWNLINDEELGSFKCLILKYKRAYQKIQPFCTFGSL